MANELTIPILPCRTLDDVLPFYEALGFQITYRQARPNPYAVVRREDMELHFAEIDGFEPAGSYGSVVVVVPDADALYHDFVIGIRAAYGKVPSSGIPRMLRPRKKLGTVAGFSVVDPGGNWLRIYRTGDTESSDEKPKGLALVLLSAARQGDARGDHAAAAKMLVAGLARHTHAPAIERLPALVYRADLAVRMGDHAQATATLAEIHALELDDAARGRLAADLASAAEIQPTWRKRGAARPLPIDGATTTRGAHQRQASVYPASMDSPSSQRLTFGQLSVGLQIILILILVGSCSGASNNSVTNPGITDDEVQQLRQDIRSLNTEVRQLRREVRRQR